MSCPFGAAHFLCRDGTRKPGPSKARVPNSPVDCLVGRGRVLQIQDASGTDVDWIWICPMPKKRWYERIFQKVL